MAAETSLQVAVQV
jgi:hypothetical protein